MQALLLALAIANPTPSPAIKTIITVHSRELCTVLRQRLAPAIGGLLANDRLVAQGQTILNRWGSDARGEYAADLGGAGALSSIDDLRAENVVGALVANIEKIEKLLDDSKYRGTDNGDAAMLESVRTSLRTVLAQQKAELNILSFVAFSNQGQDLQARYDPTGGTGKPPPSLQADITPVVLPKELYVARQSAQKGENDAAVVITPLIQTCR